MRVLDQLVTTINQAYLYPDFHGTDWPAIAAGYRNQVAAGESTPAFYADMHSLVDALGDNHSSFRSPLEVVQANAQAAGDNSRVGIGLTFVAIPASGLVSVTNVVPGSPAAHAGLKPHDSILAVNGHPILDVGAVAGPRCSVEALTVESPGGPPRKLTVVRDTLNGPTLIDSRLVPTADGSRIGYIFIPTFADATIPGQVSLALTSFGHLDGLILDVRMNPGGLELVLGQTLGYFTSGMLGQFVSRTSTRQLRSVGNSDALAPSIPLAVLIGPNTFSAGELFAGILKDVGRARLIGGTTFGLVQSLHPVKFADGSEALIAEERFDPAVSHADWSKTGIVPDVEVSAQWNAFTFATDPAIAAAVTIFGH